MNAASGSESVIPGNGSPDQPYHTPETNPSFATRPKKRRFFLLQTSQATDLSVCGCGDVFVVKTYAIDIAL
jgi:hypothetical protein